MKKIKEIFNDIEVMYMALEQRKFMAFNGEESIDKNKIIPWGFEGYEYPDPKGLSADDAVLVCDYIEYIKKYYTFSYYYWDSYPYGRIPTNGLIQKKEKFIYNNPEFDDILIKIDRLLSDKHDIEQYGDTDFDDDYCNWN